MGLVVIHCRHGYVGIADSAFFLVVWSEIRLENAPN